MKNFIIVIAMVFSLSTFANVKPNELSKEKIIVKKVSKDLSDPGKICRYYAIVEANNSGATYGSPAWQAEFLYYRALCTAEME